MMTNRRKTGIGFAEYVFHPLRQRSAGLLVIKSEPRRARPPID
jgi:hypothetical protein